MVRSVPAPLRTIWPGPMSAGLEEEALTTKLEAGVSTSATAKEMGVLAVSSINS